MSQSLAQLASCALYVRLYFKHLYGNSEAVFQELAATLYPEYLNQCSILVNVNQCADQCRSNSLPGPVFKTNAFTAMGVVINVIAKQFHQFRSTKLFD